eukprot:7472816-Pyramimonas_sp.AAC.1
MAEMNARARVGTSSARAIACARPCDHVCASVDSKQYVIALCVWSYVVQAMWCKLGGALHVAQAMRCKLCGVSHAVQ